MRKGPSAKGGEVVSKFYSKFYFMFRCTAGVQLLVFSANNKK